MPTTANTAPVTDERRRILSDLDAVWATRTNLARMYDGSLCYYLVRPAGFTGVSTRANTQPVLVRLGNRSGSQGADADRDGLSDLAEQRIGTNPNNADTDGDTIPDAFEVFGSGTSPIKADSNGNGMPDNVEFALDDPNAYADSDGDGLRNGQETAHFNSNPNSLNSDGDMLNDDQEFLLGTDAATADTDSDGDGEPDAFETANGSNPMSAQSEASDVDGDNIPDFLDPDDAETAMVTSHSRRAVPAGGVVVAMDAPSNNTGS